MLRKKYLKKFAIKKTFEVYLHPPKKYIQLLIKLEFCNSNAEVAQLVELQPSKLVVASSSLVFRSKKKPCNLQGFFYFNSFSSVPGETSYGVSFLLKIRAVRLPFNTIESPFTANQLPSLRPITGAVFNLWNS